MKIMRGGLAAVFVAVAMMCCESVAAAPSCDSLMSLSLARTTITSAQVVAAGAFAPSQGAAGAPLRTFPGAKTLQAFCRVQGVSKPSTDSHIEFEVWLPVSGWNGKYQGAGNGGFAGEINYSEMAAALVAGYATASTDTGHRAVRPTRA